MGERKHSEEWRNGSEKVRPCGVADRIPRAQRMW